MKPITWPGMCCCDSATSLRLLSYSVREHREELGPTRFKQAAQPAAAALESSLRSEFRL